MIDAALQWAADGVPVFPVDGKVPRTGHGVKDATTDQQVILEWWRQWPKAGIGGATGQPCGAWVLDVDGEEGLASLRALEAEHGALPPTRRCATGGGGLHLWFVMPEGRKVGNRARVRPGLDVRGTGGYVVLPPSLHPSGQVYRMVEDEAPAEAPDWLLDLVAPLRVVKPHPPAPVLSAGALERRRVLGIVAAACDRIRAAPEGTRNDTVNREAYNVGGYLDAAGMTADEVAPLLEAAAASSDQPAVMVRRAIEDGRQESRVLPPDDRTPEPRSTAEALRDDQDDPIVWGTLARRTNKETGVESPLATLPNAIAVLDHDRRWKGRIRYNLFASRIEIDGKLVTDAHEAEIVCWLTRAYRTTPTTTAVHEAINAVAHRHPYHPVRDYLDSLVWDGVPRLDTWLTRYAGVDDSDEEELVSAYSAKWPISIVARVYVPGAKVDSALIGAGPKGLRKSTTFRVWGGPWFGDSALPIGDKDGYQQISGKLVWELAELDAVSRRELGTVKAFMTSQVDTFRPSYGRNSVERPRQVVFCGTVNSDSEPTFLREPDRRWWIVRVVRPADTVGLQQVRDQLFAEAVVRYRNGEAWWLSDFLAEKQDESVSAYVAADPWHEEIGRWASNRVGEFTVSQVLEHALKRKSTESSKADEMRVASVLGSLGFERRQKRVDGHKGWWWTKAAPKAGGAK